MYSHELGSVEEGVTSVINWVLILQEEEYVTDKDANKLHNTTEIRVLGEGNFRYMQTLIRGLRKLAD